MKRKGFTLVELLAVIVVLAIILAVAVPAISGMIKSASKSSFSSDAKLVLNAVKLKTLEHDNFNALEINKGNMKDLLAISDENYSSVSFEMDEDKLYVRLVGTGKWEGLIACGVYTNIKVVDNTEICGLDKQAPVITYQPNGSTDYIKSSNVLITVSDEAIDPSSLKYVWTTTETIPGDAEYINTFSSGNTMDMPTESGVYYLHIFAKDTSGNISKVYKEFKLDNEVPVITLNGDVDVTIRQGTVYTDAGAIATDNISGDITYNIAITGTVNPSVRGTYTITYTVTDAAGNEAAVTRTVNVVDAESPVITILGDNPANIYAGSSYSDAGATAIDDVDGDVTSRINTTGTVNPSVVGTYTITYIVSDNAGNESTSTRIVNIIDDVSPTIAFGTNGNATWAKTRSTTVTVSDAHSGVDANSLKYLWNTSTTAPVEVSFATTFVNGATISSPAGVTGGYYLWVLAKDKAGNTTIIKTNVFNLDNSNPAVPTTMGMTYADGVTNYSNNTWANRAVYMYGGISGSTDSGSGVAKYQISTDNTTWYDYVYNSSDPLYGLTTEGTQYRYARAVDNAGNVSTALTKTIKIDVTVPSIPTFLGMTYADGVTNYTHNTWVNRAVYMYGGISGSTDSGSGVAKYQMSIDNATWYDYVYNSSDPLYGLTVEGSRTRYVRAVDNAGNVSSSYSRIIKIDVTKPVITITGSNPVTVQLGSTYSDAGATATDSLSGVAGAVQVSSNVNPNVVGTYTVAYNVNDNAGNVATQVTRTVNVVQTVYNYAYTGGQQTFAAPYAGTYKLEVWGAQGVTGGGAGGKGGYSTGNVTLSANEVLYVYVGGQSSWNGGSTGGGDGTDIRRSGTATGNRIIVAGGGGAGKLVQITYYGYGGVYMQGNVDGGYGGGTSGGSIGVYGGYVAGTTGGTQSSGYTLWQGGSEGGGGGYYGGTGGYAGGNGGCGCAPTGQCGCGGYAWNANAGAGGSGYVGGVTGGSTIAGNASMPAPGGGTETGHPGTGYARITYLP